MGPALGTTTEQTKFSPAGCAELDELESSPHRNIVKKKFSKGISTKDGPFRPPIRVSPMDLLPSLGMIFLPSPGKVVEIHKRYSYTRFTVCNFFML